MPRYGPLWFSLIHLTEHSCNQRLKQKQAQSTHLDPQLQDDISPPSVSLNLESSELSESSRPNQHFNNENNENNHRLAHQHNTQSKSTSSNPDKYTQHTPLIDQTTLNQSSRGGIGVSSASKFESPPSPSPIDVVLSRAVEAVSHELVWKVWLEGALVEERFGNWEKTRVHFVKSIRSCPKNLQWKIWISGARMELRRGCASHSVKDPLFKSSYIRACALLNRAVSEVPRKMKATALIECSRVEALVTRYTYKYIHKPSVFFLFLDLYVILTTLSLSLSRSLSSSQHMY